MKKTMITLSVIVICIVIFFGYLAITKPNKMPFIGHFFDKTVYGSLYYFNRPDQTHIYSTKDKIELKLYVFNPVDKKSESSVLLFHGGGWSFGSSYSLFKICRDISNNGITCISADYRLALKHNSNVIDSMSDARDAYKWVLENSEKLKINKNHIMVGGGSSGGHLAASLAMVPYDNNKIIENIRALIFFNPALNTTFFDSGFELPKNTSERRMKFWFFLKKLFEGRSIELSPSSYIRENLPPSIIFHGTNDRTIPISIIEDFTNDMRSKGNDIILSKWKGKGHQFYRWDKEVYPDVIKEVVKFIKDN